MDENKDISLQEVADITSQLEMLTNSLSGSDFASTPISGNYSSINILEKIYEI